jgi:O-succinylbenzoic acid--CoA ligase
MKIPHYTKIHNSFEINGLHISRKELYEVAYSFIKEGTSHEQLMGDFLLYWLDENDTIVVQTSGATGVPKKISVPKQAMVHSAVLTGEYFGLQPGAKALHCLPANFIAGKMMLVRAMILGLSIDIIPPTTTPEIPFETKYDFAAMLPAQVQHCLPKLHQIRTLIVGGAALSKTLRATIAHSHQGVFETYGMTETLSHIALRPVTKEEVPFTTLPKVSVSTSDEECLIITAPHISNTPIVTGDIVVCPTSTTFEYVGRKDFMINSGGRKLHPEQIEEKLKPLISTPFFIHKKADEKFGELPVLFVEGESTDLSLDAIKKEGLIEKWEMPKEIFCVPNFEKTPSGKIRRIATAEKVL